MTSYSSHGFYVEAGGARCYVPLHGLAEPMPRSAKEVVRKGNSYNWIVTAFDSTRRGIELALVGTPAALQFAATGVPRTAFVRRRRPDGRSLWRRRLPRLRNRADASRAGAANPVPMPLRWLKSAAIADAASDVAAGR